MKKIDKKIKELLENPELKKFLKKKMDRLTDIEIALLDTCRDKEFDPNEVAPVMVHLFADISKDIDVSYEDCMRFAAKTISMVYEVEMVECETKDIEEVHMHKGVDTHQ